MSMELHVLSDRQLETTAVWQQAIQHDGFPLQFQISVRLLDSRGFVPVKLNGKETGFECVRWEAAALYQENPKIDVGRRYRFALALRWGGDIDGGVSAYFAASSYARSTDGVIFDGEEAKIISAQRAAEIGREIEGSEALIQKAVEAVMARFKA